MHSSASDHSFATAIRMEIQFLHKNRHLPMKVAPQSCQKYIPSPSLNTVYLLIQWGNPQETTNRNAKVKQTCRSCTREAVSAGVCTRIGYLELMNIKIKSAVDLRSNEYTYHGLTSSLYQHCSISYGQG